MTPGEKVAIYSSEGKEVDSTTIPDAIEQGLRRGVVRIYLFNRFGQIYIQKRGSQMKNFPGLFDQSAAGHIDAGEEPKVAALRELSEELGIHGPELAFVTEYAFHENDRGQDLYSYDFVFTAKGDTVARLQKEEVDGGLWLSIEDLEKMMKNFPEKFTPGLKESLPKVLAHLS